MLSCRNLAPLFLVLLPSFVCADSAAFPQIDRHALAAPRDVEQSLDSLVAYLVRPARDDQEKVRAIFRWTADRIAYDTASYFSGQPGELRPEGVLWRRRAVCSGYTALFEALARRAGLQTATINGYSKGFEYERGQRLEGPSHAWNAVKVDGRWELLDVTWAAGFVKGDRFVKRYTEHYFLTPPEKMVFTHLPVDPRWQLLNPPLTLGQFERLPWVDSGLFELGIPADQVWSMIRTPAFPGFVKIFAHDSPMKVHAAPLASQLSPSRDVHFAVEAPYAFQVALVNNGKFFPLRRNGPRFEGTFRPAPGELKLGLQPNPNSPMYQMVLAYQVREK